MNRTVRTLRNGRLVGYTEHRGSRAPRGLRKRALIDDLVKAGETGKFVVRHASRVCVGRGVVIVKT